MWLQRTKKREIIKIKFRIDKQHGFHFRSASKCEQKCFEE